MTPENTKKRTVVRGTTLTEAEAKTIDLRARTEGLATSDYIRVSCIGKWEECEALRRMLAEVVDVVNRFAGAFDDLQEARSFIIAQEMKRQVEDILREGEDLR